MINTKLIKYENLNDFEMCPIIPYYYKKTKDKKICIIKTKGPFMKIMLLNEVVKHALFEPNFDIERLLTRFRFFNIHIIQ